MLKENNKLTANVYDKKFYILNERNLVQAISMGLKLKKSSQDIIF